MSFTQIIDQYQTKYNVKIQNCFLLKRYKDYKTIKKLRESFTFTELYKGINYEKLDSN